MATTSLWKVDKRLDHVIDYATDEEKTKNENEGSNFDSIEKLLTYATNPDKTEKLFYTTGINCKVDNAVKEMQFVKRLYGKEKGILAFHGYQSFKEGEVTPEIAHEIGVRLAEEMWGDRFQVVVSTHLNTDNIHNHFVLNSVSFLDGKRFCNTKKDYALMRKTSDRLCEEYGLNVLQQEDKYIKYATSDLYKELMRDSIDYAIANAKDYEQFIQILKDLDYIVTDINGTLSIRRDPYKRNTRIERQFGYKYSKENIYKRILETQPEFPYSPEPYLLFSRSYERYNNEKQKHLQFKGTISYLIYQYEKLLGINTEIFSKSNITKMTPELIQAIKKMDEFSKQVRFLSKNNINTEEELLNYEKLAYDRINPLKSERENLWKKHKRTKNDDERKNIENKIIEISKKITPLTEEIKHCNNIKLRLEKIKKSELHQKLEEERQKLEKDKKKNKNRIK